MLLYASFTMNLYNQVEVYQAEVYQIWLLLKTAEDKCLKSFQVLAT